MKSRQVERLKTIDFEKVATALMNETHQGQVHLDICEGLDKADRFILNQSAMFWQYTIWSHIYCAMMYAIKLFDDNGNAYSVSKFLDITKLRLADFPQGSGNEVLQIVAEAEAEIAKLKRTIRELRRRRNHMLAHISEQLVLHDTSLGEHKKLSIEQVRQVLKVAGKTVNSLTLEWGNFMSAGYSRTDDYSKVIAMLNDALCQQADQRDAEFSQYGSSFKAPRPKDCPTTRKSNGGIAMGRWVQLSKKHPDIKDDNEVINVHELGGKEGDQVVQGQHFFTTEKSGEAQELAIFMRTTSALEMSDAEKLFKENLWTRINDGYVHVRYFNFRQNRMEYIGEWNPKAQKFV